MSDLENMDLMIRSGEYNRIERELDQMTGFANMLDRDDSLGGNSSQENEIRNMSVNRENFEFSINMETLTGEVTFRISQEMPSFMNGKNSPIESAMSSVISERILTKLKDVVESVLIRQLGNVPDCSEVLIIQIRMCTALKKIIYRTGTFTRNKILLEPEEKCPDMVTGAFESQTSVPEFLTG